jgi:hypothetical protein
VKFAAVAITSAWTQSETVWPLILCGVVAMFIKPLPGPTRAQPLDVSWLCCVAAAAVGASVGAAFILGRRWHIDGHYRLALAVLMFTKKILESIAMLAAGIVGILLRGKAG